MRIKEMRVRDVVKILIKHGFKLKRRKGRHDVYYNEKLNRTIPVPTSHGIITRGVIKSLIRQSGIPREEFFG